MLNENTIDGAPIVVDLFAGPGGWDEGLKMLGHAAPVIGIEWDADACATALANGHARLQADISELSPEAWRGAAGVLGSPPCQGFSTAGAGKGRDDVPLVLEAVEQIGRGENVEDVLAELRRKASDDKTALVLEPLRWVLAIRPEWTAWEQVPAVMPLWLACAPALAAHGYHVDVRMVQSEQYGVPQTRKRAVLIGHRGIRVDFPAPTHSRFYATNRDKLDPGVQKWVTMADALGWGPDSGVAVRSNYGSGGDPAKRGIRTADEPAFAVTGKVGRNHWSFYAAGITGEGRARAACRAPAATITGKGTAAWLGSEGTRRVSVEEAGVLQSFPSTYSWRGTGTSQYQQVGNAVPPKLAAAILRPLISTGAEGER